MDILKSIKSDKDYSQELRTLTGMGAAAIPDLSKTTGDASMDWHARWVAAMALGRIGTSGAFEALEKCVSDKIFTIRLACIRGLGELGSQKAEAPLTQALNDKAGLVRSAAIETIVKLRLANSSDILSKELFESRNFHKSRSLPVRKTILDGLSQIKDPTSVLAVSKVLAEKEPEILMYACRSLKKIFPAASVEDTKAKTCPDKWSTWLKKNSKV